MDLAAFSKVFRVYYYGPNAEQRRLVLPGVRYLSHPSLHMKHMKRPKGRKKMEALPGPGDPLTCLKPMAKILPRQPMTVGYLLCGGAYQPKGYDEWKTFAMHGQQSNVTVSVIGSKPKKTVQDG
jgi:hypothetical protein